MITRNRERRRRQPHHQQARNPASLASNMDQWFKTHLLIGFDTSFLRWSGAFDMEGQLLSVIHGPMAVDFDGYFYVLN
ncbi:hypothetical protein SARC_01356 [Sphaeroforma arctica JP610]|uniref:Uncharacterized protein n=1 Tax=Sphaeroforma arctica JP610 TaxID=667725 RepID=A0A0L0GBW5_9EUKA|nr:hypothetical protein SARC_01356 [Sphaeroforma arctica JP610]KNC86485.1 hypothetical protein SARC_01356 [Sphaeroforma arctica JP610]|eukprot:XP_014160387.1 hypothetical protein SARC_01356 [Sphaeroforma arctica JP610]